MFPQLSKCILVISSAERVDRGLNARRGHVTMTEQNRLRKLEERIKTKRQKMTLNPLYMTIQEVFNICINIHGVVA